MKGTLTNFMFWLVAALVVFLFWSVSSRIQHPERRLSFSDFLAQVERGHIARVSIAGGDIAGAFKNGQLFRTYAPPQTENLIGLLREHGVEINARDPSSSSWLGHIVSWTPIVIMIAFLVFFMRQMQSGSSDASLTLQEHRGELKLRLLYLLAEVGPELSEDELARALVGPEKPVGNVVQREVRRALYDMLSEGTVLLTPAKKFRARPIAPND